MVILLILMQLMSLISFEINIHLNWSEKCVIVATAVAEQGTTFSTTDATLCSSCNFINSRQ